MIMARSQVQHTKYTVLLSLLMYFLLLRAFSFFFSFFCNPRLPGVLCWPPGITVLLSLTVFMLMVAEIMPATSDSVPLIGQGFFSTACEFACQCWRFCRMIIPFIANRLVAKSHMCFRSVFRQHHGDSWDVSGSHSHRPPVPSP